MRALESVIEQLVPIEGQVFVGLSGGADSAVLAYCAAQAGLAPQLLFVHHGLSGSPRMQNAAEAIAASLGLSLQVVEVAMEGTSETEARVVRYEVFERLEATTLLLGHTQSDQAETVLMHLLRGSGPVGLSGIPGSRGNILRPLMGLARFEVRRMADSLGLPFLDDQENENPAHLRNWVRAEVIPLLQERSPDVVPLLARTAELMHIPPVVEAQIGDAARLPLARLRTMGSRQRSETLRAAVRRIRPPYPASFAEVVRMEKVVAGTSPRTELEGGLVVLPDRTSLFVGAIPKAPEPVEAVDGAVWGSWSFKAGQEKLNSSLWCRTPFGSLLRGAEPGDTISMGSGSKDVYAALAESGVPRELRFTWPVVVSDDEIVWVPGVRRAPKAEKSAQRYLGLDATEETW